MSRAPGYLPENYKKSKRRRTKRRDDDGGYAGFEVEHWDGHQDATIAPRPVELRLGVPGVGGERDATMRAKPISGTGQSRRQSE